MIKKIRHFRPRGFKREKVPSPVAICVSVCLYFFGALGVYMVDHTFLLSAWLLAGPLLITVYLTFDAKGSLLNPYTLFFTAAVILSLGGYAANHLV